MVMVGVGDENVVGLGQLRVVCAGRKGRDRVNLYLFAARRDAQTAVLDVRDDDCLAAAGGERV